MAQRSDIFTERLAFPRLYMGNLSVDPTGEGDAGGFNLIIASERPEDYLADEELRDVVNLALMLGQSLLVTGDPGTGKTQLASSVAYDLGRRGEGFPEPFVFHTKTTSAARDLFYRYDTLRHFHDSQFSKEDLDAASYIRYSALGLAILLSLPPEERPKDQIPEHLRVIPPARSVVLVDELDKAPRDLPNDILNEIDRLTFEVPEIGQTFQCDPQYRPFVIFTSNSEKNLPDAFLRRCVYYHISFPDPDQLLRIVERRLKSAKGFSRERMEEAIKHFMEIRNLPLKKSPATAELLAWMRVIERLDLDLRNLGPGEMETLAITYSALVKTREDLEYVRSRKR